MSLVKALTEWVDGRHKVKTLWKNNKVELQNNYSDAVIWLASIKKKLRKDENLPETAVAYSASTLKSVHS